LSMVQATLPTPAVTVCCAEIHNTCDLHNTMSLHRHYLAN
jgi:hypothetical protein